MKTLILCKVALLLGLCSSVARAADFRIEGGSLVKVFVMEGVIKNGDTKKFTDLMRSKNKSVWPTIYLFSPGGDFEESMKLGRTLNALEMQSIVPESTASGPVCKSLKPADNVNCTCASACFFVHIGSVQRGGSYLAVHRPYYAKGRFGQLSEEVATEKFTSLQNSARAYMKEMGVPNQLIDDTLATASNEAILVGKQTVDLYFSGFLPARREWLRNKCSSLSAQDEARFESYYQRIMNGDKRGLEITQVLSLSELEDMAALGKQNSSPSCTLNIMKKKRSDAFDHYFNMAK